MSLRDWNMKLKLLRPTRAKLRLSIKSRVTNTNGRFCFTTRLNGGAHGTSYYTILISVERFESQMNLRCYSITCRSTIWRELAADLPRSYASLSKHSRGARCALYSSRLPRTPTRIQRILARNIFQ